ncbi:MAG: hypothetical protein U1E65_07655 [Myxococcota bacterium]
MATLLELGMALLAGRANKAWAARAIRSRAFVAAALGPAPVAAPAKPLAPPRKGFRTLRPSPRARAAAVDAAEAFLQALADQELERLPAMLASEVWALWPNGSLSRVDREPLLAELAGRKGDKQPILKKLTRSYTFAELSSALPRGIGAALDLVLDLSTTLAVTVLIEGGRGPPGRLMVLMTEEDHRWRARSLPLLGPDDAFVAGERAPDHERPELGISQALVRHIVNGQGALLRADLHHLMPSLFVREELVPSSALVELAEQGGPRINSTEAVIGPPAEIPLSTLSKVAPRAVEQRLRTKALEDFGLPFDRLRPKLIRTEVGMLDPASLRVAPAQEAFCLVFFVEDGTPPRLRPHIGALFM